MSARRHPSGVLGASTHGVAVDQEMVAILERWMSIYPTEQSEIGYISVS